MKLFLFADHLLYFRQGVILDRHYVTPKCSPSRASLLTGRYIGIGMDKFGVFRKQDLIFLLTIKALMLGTSNFQRIFSQVVTSQLFNLPSDNFQSLSVLAAALGP